MKLLRITVNNFKNCKDNFTIDFVTKASKTEEDKLYELQEIAPDLYSFNTMAFIGKNASGKTTAIDLIFSCYALMDDFRLKNSTFVKTFSKNEQLEIIFYHNSFIYKYQTRIELNPLRPYANFEDEHLYVKKYVKSNVKKIFENEDFEEFETPGNLPDDTSILFYIFKSNANRVIYYNINSSITISDYEFGFGLIEQFNVPPNIFENILRLFDSNVKHLKKLNDDFFKLIYNDTPYLFTSDGLYNFLSSGTTKGIAIYLAMVVSLSNGMDLIIDEIENHFHKTLVENMISLYKDPSINKKHATLIFTTHYCELLDLFSRQDNIWITKADKKVYIENMYEKHKLRSDAIKSKKFFNNTFDTAVNYDDLMRLKKALKNGASK